MVIAHHPIWTADGWWLPNDPRGSMSRSIDQDVLKELGDLHHGRKRVQPASRVIREFYERAELLLNHELLTFGPDEVSAIAGAFSDAICEEPYTSYACAIMPDHVHAVVRKHRDPAEQIIV